VIIFKKNISFAELREWVIYKKRRELSWFNKFMLWCNYLAILCLLLSYCAGYINPATFWLMAFFGIAYPILLLLNLFFVLYWILQWKPIALWSFFIVAIGWNSLFSFFQISTTSEKPNNKDVKIMSYNCMLFDLYNWSKNAQSRSLIFNDLAEENPDILCLQEYYTSEEKGDFNNTDTLTKFLKTKYAHIEYTTTMRKYDHWGVATFTKHPIVRKGAIDFNTKWNNTCIYTDMLIAGDTIRVYNIHLASLHFGKADYKFISDVIEQNETEDIEGSKNILRLLKRAFLIRAKQASIVAEHIKTCKYKVIVCGDFNDTPYSFAYKKVKGDLYDSFKESGNGIGSTYAGKIPAMRIDYILHDKSITAYNYKRQEETITDHYAISTYLRFNEK
jgi:endonuclease/exonuclease/phosphatase family metal-dependent hydrolase